MGAEDDNTGSKRAFVLVCTRISVNFHETKKKVRRRDIFFEDSKEL